MQSVEKFFIVSWQNPVNAPQIDSATDAELRLSLANELDIAGFDRILVQGCYKGETEQAYLCPYVGWPPVDKLRNLARQFGQESVLIKDDDGAYLVFANSDDLQYLGVWTEIDKARALECDAYTEVAGRFFVCVPR